MDDAAKKHALRLIPYGMYVLTSRNADGTEISSGTVNWVTQTSFAPPLVVVGGIIPDVDVPKLNALGIQGVFLPGTAMQAIVDFIQQHARARVSS